MQSLNIQHAQSLLSGPNAPRFNNPSEMQQAELDGYWNGVLKHIDHVMNMRKTIPNWLPEFVSIS